MSVPRPSSPPRRELTTEALCQRIRSGELDDELLDVLQAINDRKDALKERVEKLVEAIYGPGHVVTPPGVTPAPVTTSAPVPAEPAPASASTGFPEPIISGHIFERIEAGLGPDPMPDAEIVEAPDGPGDSLSGF